MLMIEPPPDLIMAGMPILEHRNVPNKSSLMTRQNSSSGAVVTGPSCSVEPPALL